MISIITATYNRADLIERAIKSILHQNVNDWELIIVDDCSTDNTENVVKKYAKHDLRISYHKQEKNSGPSAAWNTGFHFAKGNFITFLDSDDEYLPYRLEKMKNYLEKNLDIDFCGSSILIIEDGKKTICSFPNNGFEKNFGILLKSNLNALSGMNVMMHKKFVDKIGLFDENIRNWEDADFFIRAFQNGKFGFINEPLLLYYIHQNNISKRQSMDEFKYFFEKQFDLYKKYKLEYYFTKNYGKLSLQNGDKIQARKWLLISLRHKQPILEKMKTLVHLFFSFLPKKSYFSFLKIYKTYKNK